MSFLLRVAGQARSVVPDIPVARPKGLLPAALPSAAAPPIEQALPPAPAPLHQEPRPGPPPVSDAASERMSTRRPVDAPPPAKPPAAMSAPKVPGDDTPVVVDRRAPPLAAVEESGSPAGPARTTPRDQRQPGWSVPADPEPASDTPDPQPPSRTVLEIALPRDDAGPPPGPGPGPAEPPGWATQVSDDAGTTPGEPIDRSRVALRVEPPQRGEGAPILVPEAPEPADRPIEEGHRRRVEVLPIAQPLTSSPPLPAERALPARPAAAEKPPLLRIDQIDVVVTDPAPMPTASARSAFAAIAANRRYLRRL